MDHNPQVMGRRDDLADASSVAPVEKEEELELVNEEDPQKPPVSVADHGIAWQGRRHTWLGRVFVMRIGGRAAFVGPHWYCTVLMLGVIVGVGSMFIFRVAIDLHWLHIVGGALALLGSSEALLRCALVDPGILQPHPNGPGGAVHPQQLMPSTGDHKCSACLIMQPRGTMHCEFCQVCVAGWDHHCPWMGKCIGKSNINEFYTFLCTSMTSLAYIVVVTMLSA
mmetsp:Transcript_428/g.1429  ORF Transcript_428/g.1429 Transcript_428/m.1429 type:complete len:224 (+) Transcript_428:98-769(+)|eukprot:CAMPEP_0204572994 /NCGR_PEP_ID=MMETSP0661-20131031/39766_1 /ASSEMBLY_ACC=CAM_ASM_000606 /TAXON_ID=109239 /ORGANISM="Alexandrium margalefi, Strain AMGDE01CS-322" /LENGTH=223 /DNA_ID=CAMNT_0051581379 /DNA_START=98 /DNA_END=769 /DNA_ORIENTATION=+